MDLNKQIENCPLIFLDLETTGLFPEKNSICEVAALKVDKRKIINKFYSLVRPHGKIPYSAFCVHKISDKDLIGAPYFEDIAPRLVDFLSDSILCAYNVLFDIGFINHHLKKSNRGLLDTSLIDVFAMAKRALNLRSYKLESVAGFFGLNSDIQFHRAEDDTYVTYRIFYKLLDILKKKDSIQAQKFISLYGAIR